MKKQELLDKVYNDFTKEVEKLKIMADTPAVAVVGEMTRALKRVINNHGGTAITINGEKLTKEQSEATKQGADK